jgi:exonuclease SbcD
MKLLHTGDWHVGRTLRGRSRAAEHTAVLAAIVDIAGANAVELVVIAGDLFDTAAPSAESEDIVYRALLALADTGAAVVVVAGNHDHPRRLEAVRPLLQLGRIHVAAAVQPPDRGGVLRLEPRGGAPVRIALLPFVSQRAIVTADALMRDDAAQHQQAYADRYRHLVAALTADFDADAVNLLVAHATVVGARLGGGEREAHTVFDYHVPAAVFPAGLHYVALGHIHRAQRVSAGCPAWYAGSPLQLDFGEAGNEPGVLLVDAEPGVPAKVEFVPVPGGRRLRVLRGPVDRLAPLRDEAGDAFLRVVVEEPARAGLADDVRALFPNAVDVLVAPPEGGAAPAEAFAMEQARRSPADLFDAYLAERKVRDPAVAALFRALLEEQAGAAD